MGLLRRKHAVPALLLSFSCFAVASVPAFADSTRIATSASPAVFVQLMTGNLTVRASDQPEVAIDADQSLQSRHVSNGPHPIPSQVNLWSQTERTADGTTLRLEPETFLLPSTEDGPHDAVYIRGSGNATISIPSGTALVIGNVRRGALTIEGYKNGIFVAHVANGSVHLDGVSGTGAVQVNNGPIMADNSDFTRLRVRTVRGNMQFRNCNATQIEATSLSGTIMYDDGTFAPGLARFESERGNVLIGVSGNGVQIGAHSSVGEIYSDAVPVRQGQTDTQAMLGHGGPVVTATSESGSVIFYNGALRDHPALRRRFAPRFRRLQQKPPQDGNVHLKRMLR